MGTGLQNLQGPTGRQMVFGVIAVIICFEQYAEVEAST